MRRIEESRQTWVKARSSKKLEEAAGEALDRSFASLTW
jgi:hypothetical protein